MHTIQSDELDRFQEERSLVSRYLDHAYSEETMRLIFGMRGGFDAHVGSAWHLLVPYRGGYAVDTPLSPQGFDVALSRKIIDEYDISHRKLPALVFEFVPGKEFYLATLGRRTEQQVTDIVGNIADIARKAVRSGPDDLTEFRKHVHGKVVFFLRKENALGMLNRAAPNLLGLLGAV